MKKYTPAAAAEKFRQTKSMMVRRMITRSKSYKDIKDISHD